MKKTIIFLLLTIVFLIPSCSKNTEKRKYEKILFDYFDTVTVITGYEDSEESFNDVAKEIEAIFDKYHKLYDIYTEYEGINNFAVINKVSDGKHNKIKVAPEIIELLEFSLRMHKISKGKVNIAIGSLLSIWHSYREAGISQPDKAELPLIDELKEAYLHSDVNDIIIDNENMTVFINDAKMTLDVGAIAKGYACEQAAIYLEEKGITGYIINVGGNVRTIGKKPNGDDWVVGIENPNKDDKENPYVASLKLDNKALVTSGIYQRYYTVNGKNYHHIIDPETLMPSERYLSVSVLSNDSALADALSTALFNMTYGDGLKLIQGLKDTEALWVLPSGQVVYSEGIKNYLS